MDKEQISNFCGYLCELDKTIDLALYGTLAGLSLTLAIFLHTSITRANSEIESNKGKFEPTDELNTALAREKRALRSVLIAWWFFIIGVVHGLSFDIALIQPELAPFSDISIFATILKEFSNSPIFNLVDTLGAAGIIGFGILNLSFGAWLLFPESQSILRSLTKK